MPPPPDLEQPYAARGGENPGDTLSAFFEFGCMASSPDLGTPIEEGKSPPKLAPIGRMKRA